MGVKIMQKRTFKKAIAILAIISILFGVIGIVGVFAEEVDYVFVAPRFSHLIAADNNLQSFAGGRLQILGRTEVRPGFRATVMVELQQNGNTIMTWNSPNTNIMLASVSTEHFVARGHQYRLRLTHRALDANGRVLEEIIMFSRTVTVN